MAYRGEALNHVEPRHERVVVFHEDGAHPNVEAGLWVADASKHGDELGTVLVVIEPVPGPMVYPTQQHLPQWYASVTTRVFGGSQKYELFKNFPVIV